jgi:hypothetical protein
MTLTQEQLATLKTELNTDPMSYGYAANMGDNFNPPALAALLNQIRTTIDIVRKDVTAAELIAVIKNDEFIAAASQTILMGSLFESFLQRDPGMLLNADGSDSINMYNLMRVLKNNQPSEANVRALGKRKGSRAEQLFGFGIILSYQDVIDAVRS